MKAVCYYGKEDVRVETVPDPEILNPRDAIIRITATAICGSDLHIYGGYIPTMQKGDVLGHEFMGEVVEVGPEIRQLRSAIASSCRSRSRAASASSASSSSGRCATTRIPTPGWPRSSMGYSASGLFGYSHMYGGYAGGQAEYVARAVCRRRPAASARFAARRAGAVPLGCLSDRLHGAENCQIQPGDTVAIWGCGPVGQFAIQSAFLLGANG
jgi:threonine dehydrogenase-like Zn-dependent dehydrogenase